MNKLKLIIIVSILFVSTVIFSAHYAVTIYTPNGTAITAYKTTDEMSSYTKNYQDRYFKRTYPKAQIIRSSTKKYNCHSFAWHSIDDDNSIWINSPGDDTYWKDGSYVEIPHQEAIKWSRVSYSSDDHSAIYWQDNNFISKWGQGPLVYHAFDYCPYKSYNLRYFNEN